MNTNERHPQADSQPLGQPTRRRFLQTTALAASAFAMLPHYVLRASGQTPPSGKLNIAGIGVGGMGANNLKQCADENIVALCDVDQMGPSWRLILVPPLAALS